MVQQTTEDIDVAKRTVELNRVDDIHAPGESKAFEAVVSLYETVEISLSERGPEEVISDFPSESMKFALITVTEDMADNIRGGMPTADETLVIDIGSNFGKNYYKSADRTVPVDVLEALNSRDMTLVTGVGGGWSSWEGRPEFSDTYADFSEAVVVDMESVISERREREGDR